MGTGTTIRGCLECGTPTSNKPARCDNCGVAGRALYDNPAYRRRAAAVRANATTCWLCGNGPLPGDPWQADHVHPGNPSSELRAAHRSCNARRATT